MVSINELLLIINTVTHREGYQKSELRDRGETREKCMYYEQKRECDTVTITSHKSQLES